MLLCAGLQAKLLSRHELLLNLGPALPPGAPAASAPHSRFFALYDASAARILALFRNPSDALVGAFLSCPELFLAPGSDASAWERLAAGMLYAPPLLASLRAQLRACAAAERATLIKRLLTGLPFMSQVCAAAASLCGLMHDVLRHLGPGLHAARTDTSLLPDSMHVTYPHCCTGNHAQADHSLCFILVCHAVAVVQPIPGQPPLRL